MKKVLYISNIEVPYRVRFFNELAKHCELTVLYERRRSSNRNHTWASSEKGLYQCEYLEGLKIGNEQSFSLKILKHIRKNFDVIIIGCYNSPVQMLAILAMRMLHIPYFLNLDGEVFLTKSIKSKIKAFFLRGAKAYLTAGEKSAVSIKALACGKPVFPYFFSSLTDEELAAHACICQKREPFILVVGQYLHCKGLDIAVDTARKNPSIHYKFVGTGNRTQQFICEQNIAALNNIEVIPFLQKAELEQAYQNCAALLLPSRQECWGLVINEAASFGTPIISTWGSGAAVEFLSDTYSQYLAEPNSADSLYQCVALLAGNTNTEEYSEFLKKKSQQYSIEKSVAAHLYAIKTI